MVEKEINNKINELIAKNLGLKYQARSIILTIMLCAIIQTFFVCFSAKFVIQDTIKVILADYVSAK